MRRSLALLVTFLVFAGACARHQVDLTVQGPPTFASEPGGHEDAEIVRIVDGDTVIVRVTARHPGPGAGEAALGEEHRLRLIGIDTPESVRPGTPIECFSREASAAAASMMPVGTSVRLVKDVEETDRFERLLRYIYLGDEMVNARLVANGYAHAYTYPPNVRHSELFVRLEREARENDRGLWSPETCSGKP